MEHHPSESRRRTPPTFSTVNSSNSSVDTGKESFLISARHASTPTLTPGSLEESANYGDACTFPTPEQAAAIEILKHCDEHKVLDWLTPLRSLAPGYQPRSDSKCLLSSQQIHALSVLQGCSNGLILNWLQFVRTTTTSTMSRNSANSTSRGLTAAGSSAPNPRQRSSRSILGLSDVSSIPSSVGPFMSQGDSGLKGSRDLSENDRLTPLSATCGHAHWCTNPICQPPKKIGTCDGWRRHEKAHESFYVCMPDGPLRLTATGRECILCGARDPDDSHMEGHNTQACMAKPVESRKFPREAVFLNHLESHNVSHASGLAKQWQSEFRKFFACGFCIILFNNIADQIKHVHDTHYRSNQCIDNWDPTNVIKAFLLFRLEVKREWIQAIRGTDPLRKTSGFTWDTSDVRGANGLQLRFELGVESAKTLVDKALECGSYSFPAEDESLVFRGSLDQNLDIDALAAAEPKQIMPIQGFERPTDTSNNFLLPCQPWTAINDSRQDFAPANENGFQSFTGNLKSTSQSEGLHVPSDSQIASHHQSCFCPEPTLHESLNDSRVLTAHTTGASDAWQAVFSTNYHTPALRTTSSMPAAPFSHISTASGYTGVNLFDPFFYGSPTPADINSAPIASTSSPPSALSPLIRRASRQMMPEDHYIPETPDFDLDNLQRLMYDDD